MDRPRISPNQYFKVVLAALGSITTLEAIALLKGIDGAIFMLALAIIGGLAGYEVRKHHKP